MPIMTVRLEENGAVLGQADLVRGQTSSVGGYSLAYRDDAYWDQLIVTAESGEWLLVLGLVVACLGGLGLYVARPAEVYVFEAEGRWRAIVRSSGRLATDDRDVILAMLTGTG
jgi:hypothetical protein